MLEGIKLVVGMRGYFELSAPFDRFNTNKVVMTCKAIRNINEYDRESKTLFADVYAPLGISETDFQLHKQNNIDIVSLQGETGQWLIVPACYITKFPEISGVLYHNLMLGVNLGALPVDYDVQPVIEAVHNVVLDMLGVQAIIKPVQVSKTILVSHDEHKAITTARVEKANQILSDAARVRTLQNNVDKMRARIAELEQFILTNHVTAK